MTTSKRLRHCQVTHSTPNYFILEANLPFNPAE